MPAQSSLGATTALLAPLVLALSVLAPSVPAARGSATQSDGNETEAAAESSDLVASVRGGTPPVGLTVDGSVLATSFDGDGAALVSLTPANLSPGVAAIDISGRAATASTLDCKGCVAESTLGFDTATQVELDDLAATIVGSPIANVIVVAQSGGDFTSIGAALGSISDNAVDNRYQIRVGPGDYTEVITMKPYVDIVGSGPNLTRLLHDGGGSNQIVNTADNVELRDLTVENDGSGSGSFALAINSNGTSPRITNVRASSYGGTFNYSIYNQGGAAPILRGVESTATGGTSAVAMYNFSASPSIYDSSFTADDDTNANGIFSTHSGVVDYTFKLVNSTVVSNVTLFRLSSRYTALVAHSEVSGGGVVNLNGGTLNCVYTYDDSGIALDGNCE